MENKLSFSAVNMYCRCGLQYYFRYIEGIIAPPRPAMVLGKAFHAALESNYKQKAESHKDLPVDDLKDIYVTEVETIFLDEVLLDEDEKTKGKEIVKAEIKDEGTLMIDAYQKEIGQETMPLEVELEFNCQIQYDDGVTVDTIGYIDLITEDGTLVDTKTSQRAPQKDTAHKSQQLTLYSLGYKTLYGHLPQKLRLDYVIGNKNSAKTVSLNTTRSDEEIERFFKRIRRVVDGIRKGVFIPPDQSSWACQYCGYRVINVCKEFLI